jgi:hypothetical protein
MSLFGGLVKSDLTVKPWGRKFATYAANLPELKRPAPKIPPFDFPGAFTADDKELIQIHHRYVKAIQDVLRVTDPAGSAGKK